MRTLGANAVEQLPLEPESYQKTGSFHTWRDRQLTLGLALVPFTEANLHEVSKKLYDELFSLTENQYLFRIWNYIPGINSGLGDKERYRQFCIGRSQSFYQVFGDNQFNFMPAGTCVGIDGDQLVVVLLAADTRPDHHENPQQIPAYRYPRQFGPKSPSFARATTGTLNGAHHRYISGTASVLGYETQAIGDIAGQVGITCDNLERIALQTLSGTAYKASEQSLLSGKVYLRNPVDYDETKSILEKRFPAIEKELIYLHSDICRKDLLVEIELSFVDPIKKR